MYISTTPNPSVAILAHSGIQPCCVNLSHPPPSKQGRLHGQWTFVRVLLEGGELIDAYNMYKYRRDGGLLHGIVRAPRGRARCRAWPQPPRGTARYRATSGWRRRGACLVSSAPAVGLEEGAVLVAWYRAPSLPTSANSALLQSPSRPRKGLSRMMRILVEPGMS